MEEVPLSPKLKGSLKSPSLRVRSPSAKSNIAISRGDDDSSIDDDRPKMCVSDGSTITCVFNKKRLFGGSALAFVAVVVIMAVAIATTRSDGSSSSANHMAKVASVGGGNSNAAVGTAEVGSAAPPKVAPVAPKVVPVAPAKTNFAFVAPNSGIGGGSAAGSGYYGGKSGKSGRSCSSSDFMRSFNPLEDDLWSGSGKSGKSGSNHCSFGSSGKSGKSGGYSSLVCDAWHSSGKSGKSNSMPTIPGVSKVYQNVRSGCFATPTDAVPYSGSPADPLQGQGYAGVITPGETYCGQLALETGVSQANNVIQRYTNFNYNFQNPDSQFDLTQTIDSYLFRVGCEESVYSFLLTAEKNILYTNQAGGPYAQVVVRVRRIPDGAIGTHYSGKSGKSGGGVPKITCPTPGTEAYSPIFPGEIPSSVFIDIPFIGNPATATGTIGYSLELDPGLYEVTVLPTAAVGLFPGANRIISPCNDVNGPFDYKLKVIPGTLVGNVES